VLSIADRGGLLPLTAADGEAVSLVRHELPDLILLDLSFPPIARRRRRPVGRFLFIMN
jgi:CheY-like chemotaxis protein